MLWGMFNLNSIKENLFAKYYHLNKIRLEGIIGYSQKNVWIISGIHNTTSSGLDFYVTQTTTEILSSETKQ